MVLTTTDLCLFQAIYSKILQNPARTGQQIKNHIQKASYEADIQVVSSGLSPSPYKLRIGKLFTLPKQECECESECENKKSEALAPAYALTLFVAPSGLEPELF